MKIYEALAAAFAAEHVPVHFTLLGDGNMHWGTVLEQDHKIPTIHVRHEHTAVAAAMGYYSATGQIPVASVTCGPGFTQIATALTSAVRSRIPMVIFVGEAPQALDWYLQDFDQESLTRTCGAIYLSARDPAAITNAVGIAFETAGRSKLPVVLGVPYDMQKKEIPFHPGFVARDAAHERPLSAACAADLDDLALQLSRANAPILLAGRGAVWSKAGTELIALAEASGANLATTLPARGLFDGHPQSLGVAGGYSVGLARDAFAKCDLVLCFGASLTYHTLDGGRLLPNAKVVQISDAPQAWNNGLRSANQLVLGDANLTAQALIGKLSATADHVNARRSKAVGAAQAIAEEAKGAKTTQLPTPGSLDPAEVIRAIEAVMPKDFDMVSGGGHNAFFHSVMKGFAPERYHIMREFAAIGNALGHTLGVAAARPSGRTVVFDGDAGLLMQLQELETFRRHGLKALLVCFNDGAFGAEIHKLRADGVSDKSVTFGRPDFAAIAKGFGTEGYQITSLQQIPELMTKFLASDGVTTWDIHICDKIVSPYMARNNAAKAKSKAAEA